MTTRADPSSAGLPFVPDSATLTASGRQALALVAQHIRARGITELIAPAYHCPTMLEPFQLEGIHVTLVPVADDFLLHPAALAAVLAPSRVSRPPDAAAPPAAAPLAAAAPPDAARPCAILHCETFGNVAGPGLRAALAGAREAGHVVVVDETHSFLDPGRADADVHVASLRKWLPLPDGAYVTGLPDVELHRRECDDAVTAAGLLALHAERAGATEDAEALWEHAESLVDAARLSAAMSPAARELLAAIDQQSFVRARADGAARLRAALAESGVEVVNRSACFVAVRVPESDRCARELADVGIHEPLRWERPRHAAAAESWPEDLLTLPVEARHSGPLPRQ